MSESEVIMSSVCGDMVILRYLPRKTSMLTKGYFPPEIEPRRSKTILSQNFFFHLKGCFYPFQLLLEKLRNVVLTLINQCFFINFFIDLKSQQG